jgi:Ca2+:H+ antiporter
VRAALADRLQTSINVALGSAVSTIGLTVPVVALISWMMGRPLELGVADGGAILLALSFLMAMITYGIGRASLLSGVVHLILLGMWLVFMVMP